MALLLLAWSTISANESRPPSMPQERLIEWTIESKKAYKDPFNDVDVDAIFERDGQVWRVPAFWRGTDQWTVRFAPPTPGSYRYHLECTDKENPNLNAHAGRVTISAYTGDNPLYRHGPPRVSANQRYFEQADGTPFFWLGDTWWTGLSDRISWADFQTLTTDRAQKGFTVVQIVAGLVPSDEETAPSDPGFCNEGGCVWEPNFKRINPRYFDYADRRIQYLLAHGITPAILGGWRQVLAQMGVAKMKQHWRYIIARYGAYPVFWIAGGELYDPPPDQRARLAALSHDLATFLDSRGWTDIVRYIRSTDPYHHLLAAHEVDPPFDFPLQDETLTDFDLFQAGHRGWPSLATAITQLDLHYARTEIRKPLVVGEIGYEQFFEGHFADFQRAAFWLDVLNGAAGHTYGATGTWEAYDALKPFQRSLVTFTNSKEGMELPGSYQVGMGAKLLRRFRWWAFEPHPEWVSPAGKTLLEPNGKINGFDVDLIAALERKPPPSDEDLPLGIWHDQHGTWRLPYAAGIPREVRIIYLPDFGMKVYPTPTVRALEAGVRYSVYYWQPSLGIKVDLGAVRRGTSPQDPDRVELPTARKLFDAKGQYRGELKGNGWDEYGTHGKLENGTYTPERPPTGGDWVLVLDAEASRSRD